MKHQEQEDPEADVTNITNFGLLDDRSADDIGDVNIDQKNQQKFAPISLKVDEEEEDDFPRLSLELKLERAKEIKAEIENERLL